MKIVIIKIININKQNNSFLTLKLSRDYELWDVKFDQCLSYFFFKETMLRNTDNRVKHNSWNSMDSLVQESGQQ